MNPRTGRCYELACRRVLDEMRGVALVHGVIKSTHIAPQEQQAVICHAWVELPSGEVWEPFLDLTMARDGFMRLFDAEVIHRYDPEKTYRHVNSTGHYGPWGDMPDHRQMTLPA